MADFNYDPNIALNAANEDQAYNKENNDFWLQQYSRFNPQASIFKSAPSGQAYQNVANTAKGMGAQAASIAPGGVGSMDATALNRGAEQTGQQTSRTEDLNNFLGNMNKNNQLQNERQTSMFKRTGDIGGVQRYMSEGLPQEAYQRRATNQQDIANEWNKYYENQPNIGNILAGSAGGALGSIFGKKVGQKLFPEGETDGT